MKSSRSPINEAFERCRLLAKLVDSELRRARANPTINDISNSEYWKSVWKKPKRRSESRKHLMGLTSFVNHLAIVDMAAALENYFRARISTAVGEARKTLRHKFPQPALAGRELLVRGNDDFQGLKAIIDLISADLSEEVQESLNKVRENRNRFA